VAHGPAAAVYPPITGKGTLAGNPVGGIVRRSDPTPIRAGRLPTAGKLQKRLGLDRVDSTRPSHARNRQYSPLVERSPGNAYVP